MKKTLLLLSTMLIPSVTNAMVLDTMLLIGDEAGNGVFTIANKTPKKEFINSNIIKVDVVDGELVKTKYTKDNFSDWNVTLTHPKFILNDDSERQVGVRSLCGTNCNFDADQYYLISFEPSPYGDDNKNAVQVNFGYKPLYVIPAQESKVDYNISMKKDGSVNIKNAGNTYLNFYANICDEKQTKDCSVTIMSLAGRERDYTVPDLFKGKSIKFTVVNYDESFRKEILVNKYE